MLLLLEKRLPWQHCLAEIGGVDRERSTSPLTPVGIWPDTPDRDHSAKTPAGAFLCPTASRQELVPARKGRQELGGRRPFSSQPSREEKGICQTADFSYSAMLLTVTEPGTPLSGTSLRKGSVFPFKLEGMSVLWPPHPHIFHHKAMTGEAP